MLEIINKIESIALNYAPIGIVGWFKEYQSEKYPAYCVEPINQSISREFVGASVNKPKLKLYYIEQYANADYNKNSKDFFERSEILIRELKENDTLDGLVSQFNLEIQYFSRKNKVSNENICEISINIDEMF